MSKKQHSINCQRCEKEATENSELCGDCYEELFIPSEEEFCHFFILNSEVGAADNERRKQAVRDYLNLYPRSSFNDSFHYPPQDIKIPLVVRCGRCGQEIKSIDRTVYPYPCSKIELERFNIVPMHDFDGEINSISVYSVLSDGTKVPYVHIPTDEELEAWNGE